MIVEYIECLRAACSQRMRLDSKRNGNGNPRWSSHLIWKETCTLDITDFGFYSLTLPFRVSLSFSRNVLHYCRYHHTADPPETSKWWFLQTESTLESQVLDNWRCTQNPFTTWYLELLCPVFSFLAETVCGEISACLRQWPCSSKSINFMMSLPLEYLWWHRRVSQRCACQNSPSTNQCVKSHSRWTSWCGAEVVGRPLASSRPQSTPRLCQPKSSLINPDGVCSFVFLLSKILKIVTSPPALVSQ